MMEVDLVWQGDLGFSAGTGGHQIVLDTVPPAGNNRGMSPKQLLLAAISGCTGMDISHHLRKHGPAPESFRIHASAGIRPGTPAVFKEVLLDVMITGPVEASVLVEAVTLSQTKYCGVSAMVAAVSPVRWRAILNGVEVGRGQSNFPKLN